MRTDRFMAVNEIIHPVQQESTHSHRTSQDTDFYEMLLPGNKLGEIVAAGKWEPLVRTCDWVNHSMKISTSLQSQGKESSGGHARNKDNLIRYYSVPRDLSLPVPVSTTMTEW